MKRLATLGLVFCVVFGLALPSSAEISNAERSVQLMEKVASIVDTDKADCDQMARELNVFYDANAATIKELAAWGKTLSADEKKAMSDKYRSRILAASQKMAAGTQKCGTSKAVAEALARFKSP